MYISKRLGTAAAVLCFLWLIAGSSTRAMASAYPTTYSCTGIPAYGTASDESGPLTGVENDIVSTSDTRGVGCAYSNFGSTGIGCYRLAVSLNVTEIGSLAEMVVAYQAYYSGTSTSFSAGVPVYNPATSINLLLLANADPTTVSLHFNAQEGTPNGSEAEINIESITLSSTTGCTSVPLPGGCSDLLMLPQTGSSAEPSSLWADLKRGQIKTFRNVDTRSTDILA